MTLDDRTTADHEWYMRRCIELAQIAQSKDNTPVGSVVVINGEIVGKGIEELPTGTKITGHAEVIACQDAVQKTGSQLLSEAALYTTAEPCFMCSYVIRQCRIALVVYGVETPESDHRDDVTQEVEAILHKTMAKDPADRFQTPAEVVEALESVTAVVQLPTSRPTIIPQPETSSPRRRLPSCGRGKGFMQLRTLQIESELTAPRWPSQLQRLK